MRRLLFFAVAALLALTTGCINVDYVGQEFEPTPEWQDIAYYLKRSEIPPGELRIIGRATLTAPDGTFYYDIRERLLKEARAYGADAICQDQARRVAVGLYDRDEPYSHRPQKPLDPANVDFRGTSSTRAEEQEEYGDSVHLQGEKSNRMTIVIRAIFLKKKEEVEKRIAGQVPEVGDILGAPSEPARSPTPQEQEEEPRKINPPAEGEIPPDAEFVEANAATTAEETAQEVKAEEPTEEVVETPQEVNTEEPAKEVVETPQEVNTEEPAKEVVETP